MIQPSSLSSALMVSWWWINDYAHEVWESEVTVGQNIKLTCDHHEQLIYVGHTYKRRNQRMELHLHLWREKDISVKIIKKGSQTTKSFLICHKNARLWVFKC